MKLFFALLIGILIGAGIHIVWGPKEEVRVIERVVSIAQEKKDCDALGGYFSIFQPDPYSYSLTTSDRSFIRIRCIQKEKTLLETHIDI